jgi:hypothetical protein
VTAAKPRRRTVVATSFAVVFLAAFATIAVVWLQRAGEPETAPVLRRCINGSASETPPGLVDTERAAWSQGVGSAGVGESIVDVASIPPAMVWRYRSVTRLPTRTVVVEGLYRSGAVDELETRWSPGQEQPERSREVVIGTDGWHEGGGQPGWERCAARFPAYARKDITFGYRVNEAGSCGLANCPLLIGPGSRVRVRADALVPGEDGLVTYEVVGFKDNPARPVDPSLRATIVVDSDRRLRGAKVWDSHTGDVYFTLEAGPAAETATIIDPTGQPLLATQPAPAEPALDTVPASERERG